MAYPRATMLFAAAVFVVSAVVVAQLRFFKAPPERRSVPIRELPIQVEPVCEPLGHLSASDLTQLLDRLKPYWGYRRVPDIVHALRLWGLRAEFAPMAPFPVSNGVKALSCPQMLRVLFDDTEFQREVGSGPPLLVETTFGVGADMSHEWRSVAHQDDLLALAAEIGLPASFPVITPHIRSTIRDMLRESILRFTITQELEFTAVAFAAYLPPTNRWMNRFGEAFTFDDIVTRLVSRPRQEGSCFGTHAPYAVTFLVRVDEACGILSKSVRTSAIAYLRELSHTLETTQSPEGFWTVSPDHPGLKSIVRGTESDWITGHNLEWIALAPSAARPPRDTIRNAELWALQRVFDQPIYSLELAQHYLENSHVARALVLLEGYGAKLRDESM